MCRARSRSGDANGGADPQDILVTLLGLVFQAIGYAISAVMTLMFLAWALAIVIGVVAWIVHLL